MWTDTNRTLATALGAVDALDPTAARPKRRTYVLDAEGRVVLAFEKVDVVANPGDVLDDCRRQFGAR